MHIDEVPFTSAKIKLKDDITGIVITACDEPTTVGKDNISIQKIKCKNSKGELITITVWNPAMGLRILMNEEISINGADTSIYTTPKGVKYNQMSCNYDSIDWSGPDAEDVSGEVMQRSKVIPTTINEVKELCKSSDLDLWFDVFDQVLDRLSSEVYATNFNFDFVDNARQITTSLRIGGYKG